MSESQAKWEGAECQMCYGTGVAQMNSGDGTGPHLVRCPACNGHGREPS